MGKEKTLGANLFFLENDFQPPVNSILPNLPLFIMCLTKTKRLCPSQTSSHIRYYYS